MKKIIFLIVLLVLVLACLEAYLVWQKNADFENVFAKNGFSSKDFSNGTFAGTPDVLSQEGRDKLADLYGVQKDLFVFYDSFQPDFLNLTVALKPKAELFILELDFLTKKAEFYTVSRVLGEQLNKEPCLFLPNAQKLVDGQRVLWLDSLNLEAQNRVLQEEYLGAIPTLDVNSDFEFTILNLFEAGQSLQENECEQDVNAVVP